MKMWKEFKAFIARGNVLDMAIGVIVGGAFGKIVTSLVNDLLMPMIGLAMGGVNLVALEAYIGDVTLKYGAFLQTVIDFLIIAVCVFFFTKLLMLARRKKKEEEAPAPAPAPEPSKEELLLAEIRDLLKEQAGK
jgi:large conductance mechanosensitive channel